MIKYKKGDLLAATDVDIICHQVNCQGVMGSGIAGQIAKKYPHVFRNYMVKWNSVQPNSHLLLGEISIVDLRQGDYLNKFVCNMFAQYNYGYDDKQYTDLTAFDECVRKVVEFCSAMNYLSTFSFIHKSKYTIGMPYGIGCGLGGAKWDDVNNILHKHFDRKNDITCIVYKL